MQPAPACPPVSSKQGGCEGLFWASLGEQTGAAPGWGAVSGCQDLGPCSEASCQVSLSPALVIPEGPRGRGQLTTHCSLRLRAFHTPVIRV